MIHEKLRGVQDYFRNKLLSEPLDVKVVTNTHVRVDIDGYPIVIWYGVSDSPQYIEIYNGSIIMFDLTEQDKYILYGKLKIAVNEVNILFKMEQFKKLKQELNL